MSAELARGSPLDIWRPGGVRRESDVFACVLVKSCALCVPL